jgi:hypothetical protein
VEFFFGNYQLSEELSATLEEKSGKTTKRLRDQGKEEKYRFH